MSGLLVPFSQIQKKEEKRKRFFIHISIGEMQEIILSHGFNLPYKIKIVSGKRHNSSNQLITKHKSFLLVHVPG